jgi:hypothetical protein
MPLWRHPNELQLGVGEKALRIKGLSAGQERLISLLYRGVPDDFLIQAAEAVGAEDPAALIEKIQPALLARAGEPTTLTAEYIETHFAEICRAQATHSIDGSVVLQQRKHSRIFVQSCGETTSLIAQSLGQAAIGFIVTDDDSNFETESKVEILSQQSDSQIDKIDFAILISQNAVSPGSYSPWLGRSIAHISVVFDVDGLTVSPVIEAGKTPCLSCFHEAQIRNDGDWPAIASQLLFSKQKFDDVSARLFAAALVCQRAMNLIDEAAGFSTTAANRTGYRLSMASGKITEFDWQFTEACTCRF